jgi:hypothetical protein
MRSWGWLGLERLGLGLGGLGLGLGDRVGGLGAAISHIHNLSTQKRQNDLFQKGLSN